MGLVHIPFVKGQDSQLDSKIAPMGVLKRAENCRIDKQGRIVKRNGFASSTASTWIGGSIVSGSALQGVWSRGDERVAIAANRLYSFAPGTAVWRDWGLLSEVGVPERREAIRNQKSYTQGASVAVSGVFVCVVCETSPGVIYAIVYDSTDWSIRDQARVGAASTGYRQPRVVALGTTFVCTWIDTTASRLKLATFDTLTASAQWTGEINLPTVHNAHNYYDVAPFSATEFLIAYQSAAATMSAALFNAAAVGVTTSFAGNGYPAICGAPAEHTSYVWHDPTTGAIRYQSWPGLGANPFGGVLVGPTVYVTDPTIQLRPTVTRKSATTHTLAFSKDDPTFTGDMIAWQEFTPSTGAAGSVFTRYGVRLMSKPTYINGKLYTWGVNKSTYERAYILESHTATFADSTVQTTLARNEAPDYLTAFSLSELVTIAINGLTYMLFAFPFISIGSVASATPTTALDIAQVPMGGVERYQAAEVGGCLYLSGGLLQMFDSQLAYENGFLTGPNIISLTSDAAAGGLVAGGSYQYVLTREWRDAKGQRHVSQVSDPVKITVGVGHSRVVVVFNPNLQSNRIPRWLVGGFPALTFQLITHIYRTLNNGTVFYRVTGDGGLPEPVTASGTLSSYNDVAADTALAGPTGQNVIVYTQGIRGGLSGPLQHDPPPPCKYLYAGKDRAIIGGLEKIDEVRWSKFYFTGEPLEFSEDFSFRKRVPGRVKAVAALDDAWIVFTESKIFAIFGDGPDDSGVGLFSEPREIPSEVGCLEWRSVVSTPLGIMFQAKADAIYLLPRGLGAPVEISRPVRDVLQTLGMVITAARVAARQNAVIFSAGAGGSTTRNLVYDLRSGEWTIDVPFGGSISVVGMAEWDGLLVLCAGNAIRIESPATSDAGAWFGVVIETHPLRPGGLQRSIRTRRAALIFDWFAGGGVRLEIAPDDAQIFLSTAATWFLDGLTIGDTFRREWRLPVQKFGSVRVRVSEVQLATNLNQPFAFTGISLETESRPGMPRLPEFQRR